jgi:hypothetical protein
LICDRLAEAGFFAAAVDSVVAQDVMIMVQRHAAEVSEAVPVQENYDAFLSRLGQKALAAVEKHAELCEADAGQGYGRWWKRLAGSLGKLAPFAIETAGHQALKFHIPDGKYRVQVFALEDAATGRVVVYLPDIAALAVTNKLVKASTDGHTYQIVGDGDVNVDLEVITSETKDAPVFVKPMLGWGRRALRTSVSVIGDERQVVAVERLCGLAAEAWAGRAEGPAPVAR